MLVEDLKDDFKTFPWPGNVRELEDLMWLLVFMTDVDEIGFKNLPLDVGE